MASEMFSLSDVPSELLPLVFNKLPAETFHAVPMLDRRCKFAFERNLNRFSLIPIHYLDKLRQKTTMVGRVARIEAEYINAILKNIQEGSFPLNDFGVEYDYTENIDVHTALADLFLTRNYYRMDDENCVFASAPSYHIWPANLAVFTFKNKKNVEYLVKLRKNALYVERIPEEEMLTEAWDATRNSSSYKLPDILHL